jgi:pilus assembly protein CpaE
VVVCELTLASARDAIRLLAWLKSNAPSCQTLVVANRVQAGGLEISRKDFESSIERGIDLLIPYDSKATAQAAKLGKPIVDAVRSSKVSTGIISLTEMINSSDANEEPAEAPKEASKKSMIGGFKSLLSKK